MISMIIHSSAQPLILFCTEDTEGTSSMLASAVSLVSTGGWPAGLLTEIFHCCTLDSKAACGWVANVTSWTGTMPLYCTVLLYIKAFTIVQGSISSHFHSPALAGHSTLLAYKSLVTRVQECAAGRTGFFSDRRESIGRGWVGVERGKVERKKERHHNEGIEGWQ